MSEPDRCRDLVEACWARIDGGGPEHERHAAALSSDEIEHAARFRYPLERRRFVNRRGQLRALLSQRLGCRPRDVELVRDGFGKPSVRSAAWLQFSAAHSAGIALFAFAHGRAVGCDLERVDPGFPGLEVAEALFPRAEALALRSLPREQRATAFFQAWTRKEALAKARGEGLSRGLDNLAVPIGPTPPGAPLQGCGGWVARLFEATPCYQGAVAAYGVDWRLDVL